MPKKDRIFEIMWKMPDFQNYYAVHTIIIWKDREDNQ